MQAFLYCFDHGVHTIQIEFIQFKQKIDTKIRETLAFKELSFAFAKILQLLLAA